jgi:hypothetical protein
MPSENMAVNQPRRAAEAFVAKKTAVEMFQPQVEIFPGDCEQTLASIRQAFSNKNLIEFTFCIAPDANGRVQTTNYSSMRMPDLSYLDSLYPVTSITGILIRSHEQVLR